jgi:predicted tellurium resistance membrane protein TerC
MDFFSTELIISFITLSFLEIILGIDNLIFIAIVVSNLPAKYKNSARFIGLALAFIIRIIMLCTLSWVMGLTKPLFNVFNLDFSFNNLLLIIGGIFLIVKSAYEICAEINSSAAVNHDLGSKKIAVKETMFGAVIQIATIDFIFSFDSIITAIGMTRNIPVIVGAIIVSMLIMLVASKHLSKFLERYPTLKIVALSFIFMIGVILLADGIHMHINKGYLYFALFFTLAVEGLNLLIRKNNSNSKDV